MIALVEYDGEQHYMPKECFGGLEEFNKTKIRDAIKTKYCKDNNIKLIRVSYVDFEFIDMILDMAIAKWEFVW